MELRVHVHRDDFHGTFVSDHEYAGIAQDRIRILLDEGFDISGVTFGGDVWEHYSYGAQWGPKRLTGWQHCSACGGTHPVRSEC